MLRCKEDHLICMESLCFSVATFAHRSQIFWAPRCSYRVPCCRTLHCHAVETAAFPNPREAACASLTRPSRSFLTSPPSQSRRQPGPALGGLWPKGALRPVRSSLQTRELVGVSSEAVSVITVCAFTGVALSFPSGTFPLHSPLGWPLGTGGLALSPPQSAQSFVAFDLKRHLWPLPLTWTLTRPCWAYRFA